MPDLHQIINLAAVADDGIRPRPPVDARIGANFDIVTDDHAPQLRHIEMAFRRHVETESPLTDAYARMEQAVVADGAMTKGGVGADVGIVADRHRVADHRARADAHARAQYRIGFDHRPGANSAIRADRGAVGDDSAGMVVGRSGRLRRVKRLRDAGVGPVGPVAQHQRHTVGRVAGKFGGDHASAGLAVGERVDIFRIVEETQRFRSGGIEGRDIVNELVRIGPGAEFRRAGLGKFPQFEGAVIFEEFRISHRSA